MVLTEGYFKSNLITSEEFHGGALISDKFYTYYKFLNDGFWISKNVREEDFDFVTFLEVLDLDKIRREINENDPMDANFFDYYYRSGEYKVDQGILYIYWNFELIVKHQIEWMFKIIEPVTLEEINGSRIFTKVN